MSNCDRYLVSNAVQQMLISTIFGQKLSTNNIISLVNQITVKVSITQPNARCKLFTCYGWIERLKSLGVFNVWLCSCVLLQFCGILQPQAGHTHSHTFIMKYLFPFSKFSFSVTVFFQIL